MADLERQRGRVAMACGVWEAYAEKLMDAASLVQFV